MKPGVVFALVTAGCVAAPVPKPPAPAVPAPCLVLESPPNAISFEQRRVLDVVAELLNGNGGDPAAALRTLAGERAYALVDSERLRGELGACRSAKKELLARIEQLESSLEELKKLAIEMEMKAE